MTGLRCYLPWFLLLSPMMGVWFPYGGWALQSRNPSFTPANLWEREFPTWSQHVDPWSNLLCDEGWVHHRLPPRFPLAGPLPWLWLFAMSAEVYHFLVRKKSSKKMAAPQDPKSLGSWVPFQIHSIRAANQFFKHRLCSVHSTTIYHMPNHKRHWGYISQSLPSRSLVSSREDCQLLYSVVKGWVDTQCNVGMRRERWPSLGMGHSVVVGLPRYFLEKNNIKALTGEINRNYGGEVGAW